MYEDCREASHWDQDIWTSDEEPLLTWSEWTEVVSFDGWGMF